MSRWYLKCILYLSFRFLRVSSSAQISFFARLRGDGRLPNSWIKVNSKSIMIWWFGWRIRENLLNICSYSSLSILIVCVSFSSSSIKCFTSIWLRVYKHSEHFHSDWRVIEILELDHRYMTIIICSPNYWIV